MDWPQPKLLDASDGTSGASPANDDIVQRKSGLWVNRTLDQVKTDLTGWFKIQEVVVAGSASVISFTSIPATYKHLMVMWAMRGNAADVANNVFLELNGDSSTKWDYGGESAALTGTPALAASATVNTNPYFRAAYTVGDSGTAGRCGGGTLWLPDYAATTFNKICDSHYSMVDLTAGSPVTGVGYTVHDGGIWKSTSAITAIKLAYGTAMTGTFKIASTATLYGSR